MDGREVTFNYGDDGPAAITDGSAVPPPLPAVKPPPAPRVIAPPLPPSYPPPPPLSAKVDTPAVPPPPPSPPPSVATVEKCVDRPLTKDDFIEQPTLPPSERAPIWCLPKPGEPWPHDPPYTPKLPLGPDLPLVKPLPPGAQLPPNPPLLPVPTSPVANKRHLPVEGILPYTDDDPCPFKKHKGMRMGDLPPDYLDYLSGWDYLRKQDPRFWAYCIRNRDVIDLELKRKERER